MKKSSRYTFAAALMAVAMTTASAAPCTGGSRPSGLGSGTPDVALGAGNSSITTLSCTFTETATPEVFALGINATYGSAGLGSMAISGLLLGYSYTVTMTVTNLSGSTFSRMATELLDKAGDPNDALDGPTPDWVPPGWSTSNNADMLSFAQAGNIPRTSSIFQDVIADELDKRDFLDFVNGEFLPGTTATLEFGLLVAATGMQPFLLTQRPNQRSVTQPDSNPNPVPEPGTLVLAALGMLGLGVARRRSRT